MGLGNPCYRSSAVRPAYLSAQYKTCAGGCACGGRGGGCGCGAPPVAVEAAADCGCGGGAAKDGRTAGDLTPPGMPCPGGWARLPNGSCPGDFPSGGGGGWQGGTPTSQPCPGGWARRPDGTCPGDAPGTGPGYDPNAQLPAGWQSWTPEQRAEYARQAAARAGATPAEQAAAAERARQADNAMIAGLVQQGVGAIREWIRADNAETLARIDAQARIQIAEIQARSGSQAALLELEMLRRRLDQLMSGGGGGGYGAQQPAASGTGVVEAGVGLGIIGKLLGWF